MIVVLSILYQNGKNKSQRDMHAKVAVQTGGSSLDMNLSPFTILDVPFCHVCSKILQTRYVWIQGPQIVRNAKKFRFFETLIIIGEFGESITRGRCSDDSVPNDATR